MSYKLHVYEISKEFEGDDIVLLLDYSLQCALLLENYELANELEKLGAESYIHWRT